MQKEPFEAVCEALASILKAQIPQIKSAIAGWPDTKFFKVDKNLPSIFFVQVSERSKNVASRLKVHKSKVNTDGSGFIYTEQMRLFIIIQISLFTNTKPDRSSIGWAIKQYLTTNYRIQLSDGEFALFKLKGDHSSKGETNFYQRDLTFEVQTRILDAIPSTKVININKTIDISN